MSEAESQFRLPGGLGPLYRPRLLDIRREMALGLGGACGVPEDTKGAWGRHPVSPRRQQHGPSLAPLLFCPCRGRLR